MMEKLLGIEITEHGTVTEEIELMAKMFSHANRLGLFAEEAGPSGEALGTSPRP